MDGRSLCPTSGKAEWHLTYACDLECLGCNRASFLRKPHTPNMTIADAREFCSQADALSWKPRIVLIGGEPTLHPEFLEFVAIAKEWSGHAPHVWSNAYRKDAGALLDLARKRYAASICRETQKPQGSEMGPREGVWWTDDVFVSPCDMGEPLRAPCFQHASIICGVSVDHAGYTPCAMGGAIDALLELGVRTQRLADLFDPEKARTMTAALCRHCGHQHADRGHVAGCERRFGATPMSPTWLQAFEGRR